MCLVYIYASYCQLYRVIYTAYFFIEPSLPHYATNSPLHAIVLQYEADICTKLKQQEYQSTCV